MKRLSLALAAIGFSAGALAALPAATDPTLVAIPQLPGGFVLGGSVYYLQPSNTNGDLDYVSNDSGVTPNFYSSLKKVEPGYDWGWGINVGYIFPNTGNDVNLSYFQLDTSDSESGVVDASSFAVNGFVVTGLLPAIVNSSQTAFAKAEYDINQVDLTAGQFIDVGCRLILHPFAGLRWASLERKLNTQFTQPTSIPPSDTFAIAQKSDFSGIGPLAGIDASYYVGAGFGVVGHFDSALLVGDIDSHLNVNAATLTQAGVDAFNNFSFKADSTNRVVPVVDAKLGADYTLVFNNTANSDLTLEVGWQVSNYFNAVDRLSATATINSVNGAVTSHSIIGRRTSDLGLSGPYASLVLHI